MIFIHQNSKRKVHWVKTPSGERCCGIEVLNPDLDIPLMVPSGWTFKPIDTEYTKLFCPECSK